jgi:ABC-2 type transport system permease protein
MSPIHDQGYRRYAGERAPHGRAWLVIASAGIRTFITKRVFLGLLLLSWFQFLGRVAQIYFTVTTPQWPALLAASADSYRQFLDVQSVFVFFITVYVGSGLIANDRRANALQIYLSKPLTRSEYILGKFAILMAFLLLITWVEGLLLLLIQTLLAGSFKFVIDNLYLFPAITLVSFIQTTMAAAAMLALSSLSNSARYVAILYAALIFFSQALFNVLRFVTGGSTVAWISFSANLEQISRLIFRQPLVYETPWIVSFLMIAALIVVSGWVLERRVRGVEIVS